MTLRSRSLFYASFASLFASCASSDDGDVRSVPVGVAPDGGNLPTTPGLSGASPEAGTRPTPATFTDGQCAAVRMDAPVSRSAVDVVWVIDSSASMVDELAKVQSNLAAFIENVGMAGADTRVTIITAIDPAFNTPLGSDMNRYRYIGAGVDSGALYSVALANAGPIRDFLRPGAPLHLVMVTDDNDIMPGALFQSQMEAALGARFTLHAIASENVGGRPCANPICGGIPIPTVCGAASPGDAYYEVAASTRGETLSICTEDWSELFVRLQNAVIASVPLPCEYVIPASGEPLDSERVQVVYTDGAGTDAQFPRATGAEQCAASQAWHYDKLPMPTRIVLCPSACQAVQAGGAMDIAFGCAPILLR